MPVSLVEYGYGQDLLRPLELYSSIFADVSNISVKCSGMITLNAKQDIRDFTDGSIFKRNLCNIRVSLFHMLTVWSVCRLAFIRLIWKYLVWNSKLFASFEREREDLTEHKNMVSSPAQLLRFRA